MKKILNLPLFSKGKERLSLFEKKEKIRQLADHYKVSPKDISWISEDGKEYAGIHYPKHRDVFDYVCREVLKQFPKKYSSFEEVKSEFLASHFTGRLLPIASIVEGMFGKGSFRRLGDMDDGNISAIQTLEALKQTRNRFLKKHLNEDIKE
ncbi:MAG: hypothetical protein U9O20_04270 [Patescibacteria group bacterium]|nr:hypothetical protein [Patescibacteria group bacterium]